MRVAWCSPMRPESAIGTMSRLVVPLLREHVEVDVWEPAQALSACPEFVLPRTAGVRPALKDYDAVVYHLGNHAQNHGAILRAAQVVPGIVVAHDTNVHGLFQNLPYERWRPTYRELVGRLYGAAVLAEFDDARRAGRTDAPWRMPRVQQFPMLELITDRATGVVVHSAAAAEQVRAVYAGQVVTLPLAWSATVDERVDRAALGLPADRVLLLSVGAVQPHRHLDRTVAALGGDDALRERATLLVAGPVTEGDRTTLIEQAVALGVDLRLLGRVSDDQLAQLLHVADVSVNLRHPHTESGSASLAEAMLAGLPVVVLDSGPHAEVPPDAGVVVPVGATAGELGEAMRPLVLDEAVRTAAGTRARAHAEVAHDPAAYARALLHLLRDPASPVPLDQLLRTLARTAAELGLPLDGAFGRDLSQTVLDVVGTSGAPTGAPVLDR